MLESLFNKVAGLKASAYNFIKKETLAQEFSCEFCEIPQNTFPYRRPPVAASEFCRVLSISEDAQKLKKLPLVLTTGKGRYTRFCHKNLVGFFILSLRKLIDIYNDKFFLRMVFGIILQEKSFLVMKISSKIDQNAQQCE